MTIRSLGASLAFALLAAMLASAAAQETQPAPAPSQSAPPAASPPPETVVAIINGAKITRADVIASARSLPPQYQQQIDAIFPALIDRLIDLTLLSDEGREQNLQDDSEVKSRVAQFTDQVIQEVVIRRHIETMMTEEAIKARYEKFVAEQPAQTEVHALHILVASEAEAKDVITQLAGGADFSTLAKEKSTDPSAKQNGGDLGYFAAGDMVPEFERVAFALEKGQSSREPVQSQFGWHVIKVIDRREKTPPTLDEARGQIQELLSSELVTSYVTSLRADATIEIFNPDGTPKAPAQPQQ
ncbi:MAG: peptidylprolyl isomerase [Dongiaceae bacterium]